IGALERDGKTLIVALLGCGWPNNKSYKWQDTRKLMEHGLEHYSVHALSEARLPQIPSAIPVEKGQSEILGEGAKVSTVRMETEDMQMLLGAGDEVKTIYRGKTFLEAPVRKGEKIGEIQYQVNGETWKTEDVVAGNAVKEIDYSWCLEQTMNRWAKGGI
ncbi:MAG: D-alanyl-D-alanine carboxypeptidase, partial [Blautia producta]